jgi:hypothetical protein
MFEAEIEICNFQSPEPEPKKITKLEAGTLSELTDRMNIAIFGQKPLIIHNNVLTVRISYKEQAGG